MIALDTNLLVYAHRPEAPLHAASVLCVAGLHAARLPWAIPHHCLFEFAAVVSSTRLWREPSSARHIGDQIAAWRGSPWLRLLGDDETVVERCLALGARGRISGGQWHDARIAALCLAHGVKELWTVDRDFSRFPDLVVRNPLV